jgi:hypothetical protein
MIRSYVAKKNLSLSLTALPSATYQVYLYVWEDSNTPQNYSIQINGLNALSNYNSGQAGTWNRLGPFQTSVSNGVINISTKGGTADFSGVELWQVNSATARIAAAGAKSATISNESLVAEVYPNPVEDVLLIQLSIPAEEVKGTKVTDARGSVLLLDKHQMKSAHQLEMNVSGLRSGFYLLQLQTQKGTKIVRFLKK